MNVCQKYNPLSLSLSLSLSLQKLWSRGPACKISLPCPPCLSSIWLHLCHSLHRSLEVAVRAPIHKTEKRGDMSASFRERKSLSIAKNHPKTSQEFSEQFGPSTHKIKGFSKNSHQKLTRSSPKTWEDKFLGIPFLVKSSQAVVVRAA